MARESLLVLCSCALFTALSWGCSEEDKTDPCSACEKKFNQMIDDCGGGATWNSDLGEFTDSCHEDAAWWFCSECLPGKKCDDGRPCVSEGICDGDSPCYWGFCGCVESDEECEFTDCSE